ncbi:MULTISPECIES: hypothetical protein [Streptomyces]|uniref:Uncharacterized protein n=1 Tax=Streptomyces morookaense TaxID=1970 RepID=A0A7Y7E8Q0_STRMO|nr:MULTISPECIES: hypothetical protein [Streptomyces]MCC2280508.1 hypothetical protein [Streptomyces sp. ET3-23]NVK80280.1 hypothetical protein [Streptomyces morookaense]GHF39999.1 hypothetical protein GCM10010359_48210 [Streptomyces morookaense]
MSTEDLMSGFSFHVDAEEFAADAWAAQDMASGNPLTTTFCCSVQCG